MPTPASTLTDTAIVEAARVHARDTVQPSADAWHRSDVFPRDALRAAGELGLAGYYVPRRYGGQDLSCADVAPIFEVLSEADGFYALCLSVHNFATRAVSLAAPGSSAESWIEELAAGRALAGILITEEGGGSDVAGQMTTRAVRDGIGWRLSGTKALATFAGQADVFVVLCRSGDATTGTDDMMVVLVQADDPGVTVGPMYEKSSASFMPVADLVFDDVYLDEGRVLAPPGQGFPAVMATLDMARVHVASGATGLCTAALRAALQDAADRRLFGSGVLELQGNLFPLTDVETNVHASRLMYRHAADLVGTREGALAAAHAKRFATDAAVDAAVVCARVMGARGIRLDRGLPRILAGAQFLTMADGAQNVQRMLIGRDLLRRARAS
ncbi:acyl-CoA dehydrogenase family protein [Nocardiopsis eucommiae]|uniref:acyl-CoA dehydrogenase family protein n=1 Tax=Nocardiopsis eucommiae TaxID=2831970 RepID=UPI003D732051